MATDDPNELTTISITKGARESLRSIGRKNETYDDLIKRLVKYNNVTSDAACARAQCDMRARMKGSD